MTSCNPTPLPLSALPQDLAVIPLHGTLLLPRARLPLNIFEPNMMALTDEALSQSRIIGVVQTKTDADDPACPLYQVGCAGRIASFSETDDGRYLIQLYGLCRFRIAREWMTPSGIRRIQPDWTDFAKDLAAEDDADQNPSIRQSLMTALHGYFKNHGMAADWTTVQSAGFDEMVNMLTMICPLAPSEKQALLEQADLLERARLLTSLLEMAGLGGDGDDDRCH